MSEAMSILQPARAKRRRIQQEQKVLVAFKAVTILKLQLCNSDTLIRQ